MAAANDFDGYGGGPARDEAPGTMSRFMRNQPSYSTFDEEARIRRRDPGYLEQDRIQSLVLIGGFVASALLLFIAGFVSAFLLFDDVTTTDVAIAEPTTVVAPPVIATVTPPAVNPTVDETTDAAADAVDFPQSDFVSTAQADADSEIPPAPAPEVAAARALADSGVAVDAPGSPVVPVEQPAVIQDAEPDTPVQLVRATPDPVIPGSAAATAPVRGFVLQFGAFGDRGNADGLVALLKNKVGPVWIVEGKASSGANLFFVRGGSFETRADATAAARKLWQSDRIDSFVRSVERG